MKRPTILFVLTAFLAMVNLDSNACYLLMLTCAPSSDCPTIASTSDIEPSCEETTVSDECGSTCGFVSTVDGSRCEPVAVDDVVVCVIPFYTVSSMRSTCDCVVTPPPLTSTAAERKDDQRDSIRSNLQVAAINATTPQKRVGERDNTLSGIHRTISTTVLRC